MFGIGITTHTFVYSRIYCELFVYDQRGRYGSSHQCIWEERAGEESVLDLVSRDGRAGAGPGGGPGIGPADYRGYWFVRTVNRG